MCAACGWHVLAMHWLGQACALLACIGAGGNLGLGLGLAPPGLFPSVLESLGWIHEGIGLAV